MLNNVVAVFGRNCARLHYELCKIKNALPNKLDDVTVMTCDKFSQYANSFIRSSWWTTRCKLIISLYIICKITWREEGFYLIDCETSGKRH